jgi:UDP-glucuronate 4-epimerase
MKVMLTGAAGFIGMHTALRLMARGDEVVGVDNLNGYYAVALKEARLQRLQQDSAFRFWHVDIEDREAIAKVFFEEQCQRVVHLAAQVGVRYSVENPYAYVDTNLCGFVNVLEGCRHTRVEHLVYASSSSVYGGNARSPFSEHHSVDHPVSLYAATKKANELMAHTYSHLFGIPTTGLRFFTVYGPWGRPDMAPFLFSRAILEGRPINVFNYGRSLRDFTYVDDIVTGVLAVLDKPAEPNTCFDPIKPDPATSQAPFRVFNIGNGEPVPLMEFIEALEAAWGVQTARNYLPMQPGDVPATNADASELEAWVGFRPSTPLRVGVGRFVDWYRGYHLAPG